MIELREKLSALPVVFGRSVIEKLMPGVISSKTLANLQWLGKGPAYFKRGAKSITKDPHRFKENLLRERTQILGWAVQGAVAYLMNGLNPPESVRCWRPVQENSVDEFAKTCIETCPGGRVGKTEALDAYRNYCTENHRKPVTQRVFARAMVSKFGDDRVGDFRFYKNVRLIPRAAKQLGAASQAVPVGQQAASG